MECVIYRSIMQQSIAADRERVKLQNTEQKIKKLQNIYKTANLHTHHNLSLFPRLFSIKHRRADTN